MKKPLLTLILIGSIISGFIQCSSNNTNPSATQPAAEEKKATEPLSADAGKNIFEDKCVICHGSDGTAGIASAANLQTSKLDSASIIQIISNGKNSMPPFKSQLNPSEIGQLEQYVHSLRK